MKNFVSQNNIVSTSARGAIVIGENNFVGYACKNIVLNSCNRCTVLPQIQNVTLINCNDLTIKDSNVCYVNNVKYTSEGIQSYKVRLNSDQIKTLNSVPLTFDLPIDVNPSTVAIEITSANINWRAGESPYFSLTEMYINMPSLTNGWVSLVPDFTVDIIAPFFFDVRAGFDIVAGISFEVSADADSTNGNGFCDININYRLITL